MANILVQAPTLGLNGLLPVNMIDVRAAGKAQNVIYQNGRLVTHDGFDEVDMTTGLNSGDTVLHVYQFTEADRTSHILAHTTEKIYEHDRVNATWSDRTQSGLTMSGNLDSPVSAQVIAHNDTAIYYDDNAAREHAYLHVIDCDGGNTAIQRWAGKNEADFASLLGGDGYHDGTTHRAWQVVAHKSRLVLINPRDYSSATNQWISTNYRVRWPQLGKIQSWSGTGSGFADLLDMGGQNVWAAPLQDDLIVYQNNSIWSLYYVGGTAVFDPKIVVTEIGLLAPHCLVNFGNIHYFLGSDYNVYAYMGGSVKAAIGDPIRDMLLADMETNLVERCWMTFSADRQWLYVLFVPAGGSYITAGYAYHLTDKIWTKLDFSTFWTAGGITAASLVPGDTYETGDTYQNALDTNSGYDVSDDADVTLRYGDVLCTTTSQITMTRDATEASWCVGGLAFYCNCGDITYSADFSVGCILLARDGSDFTQWQFGNHYYAIESVGSNCATIVPRSTGLGTGETTLATPCSSLSWLIYDPSGDSYRDVISELKTYDRLVVGSVCGLVEQFDPSYTSYGGSAIDQYHRTPVMDLGLPGNYKRWPGIRVVAKGDAMYLRWRTGNFDTSETGWTDTTVDLTTDYAPYIIYFNTSARCIQAEFADFSGGHMDVREFEWLEPRLEDDR